MQRVLASDTRASLLRRPWARLPVRAERGDPLDVFQEENRVQHGFGGFREQSRYVVEVILSMYNTSLTSLTGGVIYPIMLHKLISQVGFPWAVRIIGFTILATLMIPNFVMRMRARPASKRKAIDWTAFKDKPFMIFTVASVVGYMGLYMPFFYIESFAIQNGITNANLGFYLLSVLNAASTFGRILPNFVADKIGAFNVFIPATLLSGVIALCAIPASNLAGIICICVFYGFCSGAFVSMPPTIMVHLTENRGMIGTRMGMSFGATSIGMLIGAPIGGQVLKAGGYTDVWVYGGVLICSGGAGMILARTAKYGPKLWAKA